MGTRESDGSRKSPLAGRASPVSSTLPPPPPGRDLAEPTKGWDAGGYMWGVPGPRPAGRELTAVPGTPILTWEAQPSWLSVPNPPPVTSFGLSVPISLR